MVEQTDIKQSPPRSHGYSTAEANPVRSNLVKPGRFGLLFPELASSPWTTGNPAKDHEISLELGKAMHTDKKSAGVIPAGFTYFGQFVDHDITFDPTSIGENAVDVDDLVNFRTPALDLDSLYGSGPRDQPYLYQRNSTTASAQFLVGQVVSPPPQAPGGSDDLVKALDAAHYDLPRVMGDGERTAILGDKRNDENLIVAQLHRTLLHFHNAVSLEFPLLSFADVRRVVTHHYQEIVLHEFLPLVAGEAAVEQATKQLHHYKIGPGELATQPFIPLEFSGAAYRFGHSLVRSDYHFNKIFNPTQGPALSNFRLAFTFTGDGKMLGLARYPSNWLLDWRRFFPGLGKKPQFAFALDASLTDQLRIGDQDDSPFLAQLNLIRGFRHYKLASGQAVAGRAKVKALTPNDLKKGTGADVIKKHNIASQTPLWFYLLKEAEVTTSGKHLGPLGGAIVSEVFLGLLRDDPESLLNVSTPQKLKRVGTHFTIADLLNFVEAKKGQGNIPAAGVINPLQ